MKTGNWIMQAIMQAMSRISPHILIDRAVGAARVCFVSRFIGATRLVQPAKSWLRVLPGGSFAAFSIPLTFPVWSTADGSWRTIALHIATDHAGTIAALFVASVLTITRPRQRAPWLARVTTVQARPWSPGAEPDRGAASQNGRRALSLTSFMTKKVRICRTPGSAISFCPCSLLKSSMSRTRIFSR